MRKLFGKINKTSLIGIVTILFLGMAIVGCGGGKKSSSEQPVLDTAMVKININETAGTLTYTGSETITFSGISNNTGAWLIYPRQLNLLTDTALVSAKVTVTSTSGHNGVGLISLESGLRKGYEILTPQGIKRDGCTNGGGGNSLTWVSGSGFVAGTTYVFKCELKNAQVNFYVYDETGNTLLASKTGDPSSHATTDQVYLAVGGTAPYNAETGTTNVSFSNIKVGIGAQTVVINELKEANTMSSLSVDSTTVRIPKGESIQLGYAATKSGGAAAQISAVSSDLTKFTVGEISATEITLTGMDSGSDLTLTVTNVDVPTLTKVVTVIVTDYPISDSYTSLTSSNMYPSPNATGAFIDGKLRLTFESAPTLTPGGFIDIFNSDGTLADSISFEDESQVLYSQNLKVKDQLVQVSGNNVYIIPHIGKIEYGKTYYVAIAKGMISGTFKGAAFNGFSDNKDVATWKFSTKTAPASTSSISVDGAETSTANFRTIQGALMHASGTAVINVAAGTYNELISYKGGADITLAGPNGNTKGNNCVITWKNAGSINDSTHTRASFYFSGSNLVMKNLSLINTYDRGRDGTANGQAETLYFANGAGKTLAAYNCSFKSHQDTIQTSGKGWFYKCYIEGDTDFIWGNSDVTLFEECELKSVSSDTQGTTESKVFVSRTAGTSAIGKGYVAFKSTISGDSGMTDVYFARNAGGSGFYDQIAFVDSTVSTAALNSGLWKNDSPILGIDPDGNGNQNVGLKIYNTKDSSNNTINSTNYSGAYGISGLGTITSAVYAKEYNGRRAILNRVYSLSNSKYQAAATAWDITSLETAFGAATDASAANDYSDETLTFKTYSFIPGEGVLATSETVQNTTKTIDSNFVLDATSGKFQAHSAQYGTCINNGTKINLTVTGPVLVSVDVSYNNSGSNVKLLAANDTELGTAVSTIGTKTFAYTGSGETLKIAFTDGQTYISGVKVTFDGKTYSFIPGEGVLATSETVQSTTKTIDSNFVLDATSGKFQAHSTQYGTCINNGTKINLAVTGPVLVLVDVSYNNSSSNVKLLAANDTELGTAVSTIGTKTFAYTGSGETLKIAFTDGQTYISGVKVIQ